LLSEAKKYLNIYKVVKLEGEDILELSGPQGNPFARYNYDPYGNIRGTQVTTTALLSNLSFNQTIANLQPLRYAYFFYDREGKLIREVDENGTELAYYIYTPSGKPLATIQNGNTYYYHTDGKGDVVYPH
jgi:YD repeat-containing protein